MSPVTIPPPARGRPAWLDDALVAAAAAAHVGVALAARHFPYQDAPNHLARYALMERHLRGEATPNVAIALAPGPYIAVDLLGVALVRPLGPRAAQDVLTTLAIAVPVLGLYLLLRAAAPGRRGWALAAVLFGYSWFVLAGMLNFAIGVGLALCLLAAWWPRRAAAGWPGRLALAAGGAALFFVHLSAPMIALVVVWTDWLVAAVTSLRAGGRLRAVVDPGRLTTAAAVTAGTGAAWVATALLTGGDAPVGGAVGFRTLAEKLLALGSPFYSFDLRQAGVMAAGYAATLGAFLYANRRALRVETFVAAALICLTLFFVFPRDVGGAGGVDLRWLIPAYLLPFCLSAGGRPATPQRPALWVGFVACLLHAGVVWAYSHTMDRQLDAYDQALARVPAGTRLLPLLADEREHPRVGPYRQYASWHVVRARGQVPGLWSRTGPGEGEPPIPYMRHFATIRHTYQAPDGWAESDPPALDWGRIAAEYDYVVGVIGSPRVRAYMRAHAPEVFRAGDVIVYRTRSASAAQGDEGLR